MRAMTFMMIAFLPACYSSFIVSVQAQNASAIFGTVLKYDRDPLTGNFRDRGPVFGADISLEGPQGSLTTVTDGKGAYRFPGLAEVLGDEDVRFVVVGAVAVEDDVHASFLKA